MKTPWGTEYTYLNNNDDKPPAGCLWVMLIIAIGVVGMKAIAYFKVWWFVIKNL